MHASRRIPAVRGLVLALVGLAAVGCSSRPEAQPPVPEPPAPPAAETPDLARRVRELEETLDEERRAAALLRQENAELQERLAAEEAAVASLEERYLALEGELAGAVEEVLRSSTSARGVRSRAFATSRISEVRVQLRSVPLAEDPEVAARVRRARDLLTRADEALEKENYGGASYLAERAGELVHQARIVSEIRSSSDLTGADVIPIVPPREVEVITNANLRAGPGIDQKRVGGLQRGQNVLAVARSRDWIQVETETGLKAWIHSRLVQ